MARDLDARIQDLRRHLHRRQLAALLCRGATLAVGAAGTLVLLLRHFAGVSRTGSAAAFLLLLPALVVAQVLARRRRPGRDRVAALLDLSTGATGLVLTEALVADPRWLPRVDEVLASEPPPPAVRWGRLLRPVAAAVAFAAAALLVPVVPARAAPPRLPPSALDELEARLEVLEELAAVEDPATRELRERFESLEKEVESRRGESTFEALDRLAEALDRRSREVAEALDDLRAGLDGPDGGGIAESIRRLRQLGVGGELGESLEALERQLDQDAGGVDAAPRGVESVEGARRREEASRLAGAAATRLRETGAPAPSAGKGSRGAGGSAGDRGPGVAGGPERTGSPDRSGESVAGAAPGSGGQQRGPGPAPLSFAEGSELDPDSFRPRELSAAELDDLENTAILSVSAVAPEVRISEELVDGLPGSGLEHKSAWRRRLAPRHREAVRKFFQPGPGERR
jgi:hypothetical protein